MSLKSDKNFPSPSNIKMINAKPDAKHLKFNAVTKSNHYALKLICQSHGFPKLSLGPDGLDVSNLNSSDENSKRLYGNSKITRISAKKSKIDLARPSVPLNLMSLDLSLNELQNLHVPQGSFSKIQKLDLSYNFLPPTALVDLSNLQCLRSLILVGNELTLIPAKLRQVKFQELEDLNLDDNKLHAAADIANLAQLPNLQRLSLANNEFASFPILRVETKTPASKIKCPAVTKSQAQHKTTEFEIIFDDIVTHKGVARLISACIPKHQPLHCSRKSTLQKTSLRQISPHRGLFKKSTKTPTRPNFSNPPLIFPKLIYLDMGENMLTSEEAIIPVVVCPHLRALSIYGNPFVEEFTKAPPKIQTILVEQYGISIECERSKFWWSKCSRFGPAKSDQQKRDQLPPLTATVKKGDEEFEKESTLDDSKALDSHNYPLLSQHELSIEYNELPMGIQKCLREFKSMDTILEESEMRKVDDNNVSPTEDSSVKPKWWTGCVGNKDEDEGVESEVKIANPFLYEASELSNSDLSRCKTQEKLQIQQKSSRFLKEGVNFGSPNQAKWSGRHRRSRKAIRHSFFKSNGPNGLQKPKISPFYRKLEEAIESSRDSIE